MLLYGGLAALCLIAGFGLGMYEYELRRQIVHAVHEVRPDLERLTLFARARSLRNSNVQAIYREHYPDSSLLRRHRIVIIVSPACFIAFAILLALAIKHS
jgi:hypothetical protein